MFTISDDRWDEQATLYVLATQKDGTFLQAPNLLGTLKELVISVGKLYRGATVTIVMESGREYGTREIVRLQRDVPAPKR
ncbi:hypothetical protein NPJ82_09095 [Sphingomonas sp. NY01]|uniref:hypothetical protein n=1 Tax=Sphingomonas sp. NY01 TaxID=2968057 RepID=UPI00315C55DA